MEITVSANKNIDDDIMSEDGSATIPYGEDIGNDYDELSDDTLPYDEEGDWRDDRNNVTASSSVVTSSGRIIKKKTPTDYEDL